MADPLADEQDGLTAERLALCRIRDERFALLFLLQVTQCAESHPEILREALGKVFDLSGWVQSARDVQATCTKAMHRAIEANHLIDAVQGRFDRLEEQLDRILEKQAEVLRRQAR
jgi:hypothetical protein